MQYTDVTAAPASGGIDSYSSRGKIGEGYIEDAVNMDVDASGRWSKRHGYETSMGWLPLRARRFIQDGTSIRVHFDSSQIINLATVELGPIIMYGKLPQLNTYGTSSYSDEPNVVYFDGFQLINRDTLSVGTHTLSKPAADTGLTSKYVYMGLAISLSQGNASNELLTPGLVQVNTATFDVSIEYTATTQTSAYTYYIEKQAEAGVTYVAAWPGATTTFQIPAATHGLSNSRISVKVFEEAAGVATEVIPTEVYITSDGQVSIELDVSITGYVILSTVDSINFYSSAAVTGVNTLVVPSPPSSLCFYYIYFYDSMTGNRHQVMPSLVHYDADLDETSVTYELATGSETVEIYYEAGTSIANIIALTDPAGSATTDTTEGSFVVWGIGHENVYTAASERGGHIHHLDDYKSAGEDKLVCAVNGSLYYQAPYADAPASFLLDTKYTSLNSRVDGEQVLGPVFSTTDEARTRGNVFDASIVGNTASCTDVVFVSAGISQVTLAFTSKTGLLASSISTSDYLTVSGLADQRNNGTFLIRSIISEDAVSAVVEIANASALDTTIEESGSMGRAGVFTDILTFSAYHRYIAGDFVYAEGTDEYEMVGQDTALSIVLSGLTEKVVFSSNLLVTGRRTGRVVPLRQNDNTLSVENFVRGDSLDISGVTQKPVIRNVQPDDDVAATAATVSGITTLTLASDRVFNEGQYITLFGDTTNTYNGEWQIATAPSSTSLTLLTPLIADTTGSMKILGKCVELDKAIEWEDSFQSSPVFPVGRWLPIEAPSRGDSAVLTDTSALLFSSNEYSSQPNVSSTVVSDGMFFTNGDDVVCKYDGVSVTKAGLSRTIPSAFMSFDNTVPSILKGYQVAYTDASVGGKSFTVGEDAFDVGDRIYDSTTSSIFVVTDKNQDIANSTWKLVVAGDTSGLTGTGTLTQVKRRRYYVRFNLIDVNDNILSSNAANSSDMYFDIVQDGRVLIKLSYYLPQGFQDYMRLEAELYSTLSNAPAPFFLNKRIAVDMNYSGPTALEFLDDTDDEFLTQLDVVSSALLQTEIGRRWQPSYRAKCLTTLDNSLIAANLKGWPRHDITIKPTTVAGTIADLDGLRLFFKKDSDDTETAPDFISRVGLEFTNANTLPISQSTSFTFPSSDVNTATDQITKTAHGMVTGDAVRFTGTLPSPLVQGTTYYAIRQTANTFSVATTVALAQAGTPINLTTTGSSTISLVSSGGIYNDTVVLNDNHYLSDGDWAYLFYSAEGVNQGLTYSGWYQVVVVTPYVFRIVGYGRGTETFGSTHPNRFVRGEDGYIPVWIGTDGNYNQVNGNSEGSIELVAARRLADAINFCMSYNQYLVKATYGEFQPWLTAYAGSDYAIGQCVVECQLALSTTPELVVGTLPASLSLFVNNLSRDSGEQVGASTPLYPSRVSISYKNYPELFDNLDGDRSTSDSIVDINPADGQEVVGVMPFFAESTTGIAALDQTIVVFKENSVYALDTATRTYKRISGRGATAGFSITAADNSILFANLGGIYRVTRQLKVEYVGKMMDGAWKRLINKQALTTACASHWSYQRQYKLSLPVTGATSNTAVFVMNYDREEQGLPPAWTRYDNVPATMWANQGSGNFFGSTEGIVFQVRQYGTSVDYRDNTSAITSSLKLRPEDFGIPGIRKTVPAAVLQLDTDIDVTSVNVSSAINLSSTFEEMARIDVDASSSPVIKCSIASKKGTHVQIQVEHSEIDEEFAVVGVNYRVGRLDITGVSQAKDFSS